MHRASEQWRRQLQLTPTAGDHSDHIGSLIAFAYPDRIAQRIADSAGRYRLTNGRGASFQTVQGLSQDEYLVVAQLDATGDWARVLLAAPVTLDELKQYCVDQIQTIDLLEWDSRSQSVRARRQRRLGQLILDDRGLHDPDHTHVMTALLLGIQRAGLACLPWTKELQQWRRRVALLHHVDPTWPDLSDEALEKDLSRWLGPFLDGLTSLAQIRRLDLRQPLESLLTWQQRQELIASCPHMSPSQWFPCAVGLRTG